MIRLGEPRLRDVEGLGASRTPGACFASAPAHVESTPRALLTTWRFRDLPVFSPECAEREFGKTVNWPLRFSPSRVEKASSEACD